MVNEKVLAMVAFLGLDEEEIENVEVSLYNENILEYEGAEYLVVTDEEADEEFYDFEKSLIDDCGGILSAVSDWAKEYILDNFVETDWFVNTLREYYESYIDDIKYEEGRLEEEMESAECETEEEFLDYLCGQYDGEELQYFIDNFGQDYVNKIVEDNNLIDIDEAIDWLKREDGRGILASYDGVENEEGYFYIYRLN